MTCKVLQTIARYQMLQDAASVCVGVSGGVDSVCLLHLLLALQPQFGYSLRAVHVNHCLRGESADRDERFVRALCASLGVPCTVVKEDAALFSRDNAISQEEAGRMIRYAAFEKEGCDRIAVAHTRSDRIETSIFHLSRGTSLRGASGIPPTRGNVIRPLIDCTRAEVEAYAAQNGLRFVTDETNLTDAYTRNRIRHQVMEPLRKLNPGFEENWSRFLNQAASQQDFMDQQADLALEQARMPKGYSVSALCGLHESLLSVCVEHLLRQWMRKMPEARHVALCLEAVRSGAGQVSLAADRFFSVKNGCISLALKQTQSDLSYCIKSNEGAFQTPYGVYLLKEAARDDPTPAHMRLDAAKLQGELTMRTRLPHDRFSSPVRQGSKSFKKLFNEAGLSLAARAKTAVLCCDGRIAWVEGFGADRAFCADQDTKTMLIVQKEELS